LPTIPEALDWLPSETGQHKHFKMGRWVKTFYFNSCIGTYLADLSPFIPSSALANQDNFFYVNIFIFVS